MSRSLAATMVLFLCACSPDARNLEELRKGQREIRAKLAQLEKKLDGMAAAPAVARPAQRQVDPNRVYDLPVGDSPTRGPEAAPVVITEFSDFQCPFCARVPEVIEQVLAAYPAKVKFVYKDFPLTSIHPEAMNASRAAQAAHRQGKFWEMHDRLFANQQALQPKDLRRYARQIGLDLERFDQDMTSVAVQDRITQDMKLARAADVRGTPSLFVNGRRVRDRSVEGITAMVEEALGG